LLLRDIQLIIIDGLREAGTEQATRLESAMAVLGRLIAYSTKGIQSLKSCVRTIPSRRNLEELHGIVNHERWRRLFAATSSR